jgi:flagellar assembly protein FliH
MSWSDGGSKIVKNAQAVEKFKFKAFHSNPDAAGGPQPAIVDDDLSFVAIQTLETNSRKFIPFQRNTPERPEETVEPVRGRRKIASENDIEPKSPYQDAQEAVLKAREEMERLKAETCHNCTLLEQEAWEKGFESGKVAGYEAGEKKANDLVEQVQILVDEMTILRHELLKRYENQILELIFSVSKKIVNCEISVNERVIRETVLHALQLAAEKDRLVLNLNPDDVELIEKLQTTAADPSGKLTAAVLRADASVARGGCRLETPHGDIDATIETRLDNVYENLKKTYQAQP